MQELAGEQSSHSCRNTSKVDKLNTKLNNLADLIKNNILGVSEDCAPIAFLYYLYYV